MNIGIIGGPKHSTTLKDALLNNTLKVVDKDLLIEKLNLDKSKYTKEEVFEILKGLSQEELELLVNETSLDIPEIKRAEEDKELSRDTNVILILDKPKIPSFDLSIPESQDEFFAPKECFMRTPSEIKKDIKYCKNPLQLKSLNKELSMSHKYWR